LLHVPIPQPRCGWRRLAACAAAAAVALVTAGAAVLAAAAASSSLPLHMAAAAAAAAAAAGVSHTKHRISSGSLSVLALLKTCCKLLERSSPRARIRRWTHCHSVCSKPISLPLRLLHTPAPLLSPVYVQPPPQGPYLGLCWGGWVKHATLALGGGEVLLLGGWMSRWGGGGEEVGWVVRTQPWL
jgi:hypothetical protein